ncbi:MAG TPA: metallophosphoesterase, partial [Gaiellaceae bacterium]|nr:metallophosphoesterase [Gaiellaceae bacterium]
MTGNDGRVFTMVQLSDLHCGQQFFLPNLLERAIAEVNELAPDVVIVSGDLTTHGFKDEYALAKRYLDEIECESMVVIPGNHDSRNVGYVHFEELFGDRNSVLRRNGVTIVSVDSTEPDLDNGQIGRGRYRWIEEQFADQADLRVFVLHHHLLPIPGTGRERNIV